MQSQIVRKLFDSLFFSSIMFLEIKFKKIKEFLFLIKP